MSRVSLEQIYHNKKVVTYGNSYIFFSESTQCFREGVGFNLSLIGYATAASFCLLVIFFHAAQSHIMIFQTFVKPESKFWPSVGRINEVYGDQNLVCKL